MFKKELSKIISTWFYSGLAPKAPGTFGSAATLPFVYVLAAWQGWTAVLAFALIVSVIGIWAADTYAKAVNIKDPGFIVIDETARSSHNPAGGRNQPVALSYRFCTVSPFGHQQALARRLGG